MTNLRGRRVKKDLPTIIYYSWMCKWTFGVMILKIERFLLSCPPLPPRVRAQLILWEFFSTTWIRKFLNTSKVMTYIYLSILSPPKKKKKNYFTRPGISSDLYVGGPCNRIKLTPYHPNTWWWDKAQQINQNRLPRLGSIRQGFYFQ